MVREALDAFVAPRRRARASASSSATPRSTRYYAQIFRELLTYMMEDPRNIYRATRVQSIAKYLERDRRPRDEPRRDGRLHGEGQGHPPPRPHRRRPQAAAARRAVPVRAELRAQPDGRRLGAQAPARRACGSGAPALRADRRRPSARRAGDAGGRRGHLGAAPEARVGRAAGRRRHGRSRCAPKSARFNSGPRAAPRELGAAGPDAGQGRRGGAARPRSAGRAKSCAAASSRWPPAASERTGAHMPATRASALSLRFCR